MVEPTCKGTQILQNVSRPQKPKEKKEKEKSTLSLANRKENAN